MVYGAQISSGIHRRLLVWPSLVNTAGLTSPALSRKGKRDMAMKTRLASVLLALVVAVAAMLLALGGPLANPAKTQVVFPPTLDREFLSATTSEADPLFPMTKAR
jgi:hypothetical protein